MKSAVKPGQVLILVLLVVVVSLAVGLSVASRNITNIRTSTQTEESQKAFSAAEGGIESVLSQGLSSLVPGTTQVDVGNIKANVDVTSSGTFQSQISPGSVGQIKLDAGSSGKSIKIQWAKTGETPVASVEITYVYGTGSNANYRWAYTGGSAGSSESGFSTPGTSCDSPYTKCVTIALTSPLHDNPTLLRIRPFWGTNTFRVSSGTVGYDLPTQTYTLKSTASTADGITRTVQVTKTLPQLPAVFDYAIYSDSAIVK